MKRIKFVIIIALITFLIACNSKEKLNKEVLDKFIQTLPYELNEDLSLPNTFTYQNTTYDLTYKSNNPDAITDDGKIVRAFKDQEVSIKVRLTYEDAYLEDDVSFMVVKLSKDEIISHLIDLVNLDEPVKANLQFPSTLKFASQEATLSWQSSNQNILSNTGVINRQREDGNVDLSVTITYLDITYTHTYNLVIEKMTSNEYLSYVISKIEVPESTKENINLPYNYQGVGIIWSSSHPNVLTNEGVYKNPETDTLVTLNASFLYDGKEVKKSYTIMVYALTALDKFNRALEVIDLPEILANNINLNFKLPYNIKASWKSLDESILTDYGFVTLYPTEKTVTLVLTLSLGEEKMEKEFTFKTATINEGEVHVNNHIKVDYAKDFVSSKLVDLVYDGEKLVIAPGKVEGSYESPIYKSNNFTSLVGSWAAITNTQTTAELLVRVRVNGSWSKYFTYGKFGLGLQNAMQDQTDTNAKLDDDIIFINSGKLADAFQYKVVLRRNSTSVDSAKLSLVAITLEIPNYNYPVDISNLPNLVSYDLPNLYQIDVPVIGNSICSPTSAAMLLMYHGHTFTDQFPHRETANLFYDHGNKIYGNWVYNTVGMSAYGENTYVRRIYSFEELMYHLATVGPVALSIKGNTGRYTTNGHLLVVSGYEVTENGRYILVHDPNLKEVEYKYSESIFNNITRNVIYVMEKK